MAHRCAKFNNWIENNAMLDLGFSGPSYTWVRGLNPTIEKSARLDKALCSSIWRTTFLEGAVWRLLLNQFDHLPLLVIVSGLTFVLNGPRPFSFRLHEWHTVILINFLGVICLSQLPLVSALGLLSEELFRWNKEVFGNLFWWKESFGVVLKPSKGVLLMGTKVSTQDFAASLMVFCISKNLSGFRS